MVLIWNAAAVEYSFVTQFFPFISQRSNQSELMISSDVRTLFINSDGRVLYRLSCFETDYYFRSGSNFLLAILVIELFWATFKFTRWWKTVHDQGLYYFYWPFCWAFKSVAANWLKQEISPKKSNFGPRFSIVSTSRRMSATARGS